MSLHRRAFTKTLAALGVTAAAPALTTATPAWAQGKTIEVSMKNNPKALFVPATVNCKVGDTVNWTNPGIITHSVTFDPAQAATKENVVLPAGAAAFDSGNMEEGATFSHSFTVKGTYKYVCKFHEAMGMTGTVIVS
jgi:plastocyanin